MVLAGAAATAEVGGVKIMAAACRPAPTFTPVVVVVESGAPPQDIAIPRWLVRNAAPSNLALSRLGINLTSTTTRHPTAPTRDPRSNMASQDVSMDSPPPAPPAKDGSEEPMYGGYSRFEIELEFVQSLANPFYLNHLASQKLLSQPAFVAYLAYLRYWSRPPYLQYLTHPGPTLRHLELLQQERFRQDIMSPDLVARLVDEEMRASVQWHREAQNCCSVLAPAVAARHALVEARHGLVGTADLDLEEGGLVAVAAVVGALHAALLRIVPGARPAEDVLLLLALVDAPREDGLRDAVLEGARPALESVEARVGARAPVVVCVVVVFVVLAVVVLQAPSRGGVQLPGHPGPATTYHHQRPSTSGSPQLQVAWGPYPRPALHLSPTYLGPPQAAEPASGAQGPDSAVEVTSVAGAWGTVPSIPRPPPPYSHLTDVNAAHFAFQHPVPHLQPTAAAPPPGTHKLLILVRVAPAIAAAAAAPTITSPPVIPTTTTTT
ncbi:Mediator of RNA polymerase II transcription subunit 31 [Purpureocillium lilacinum]|uniref:Mediator of RNA polymerase II transcription subunit 31 n=1 Tax=Purpureocillium lilacinum TaxID=33203 RepID=A0A2U3E6G2_PURLI|nr:Mediator of RNA polymerase II transcription subunit 31 [Purpureocillium lilacinum]